MQDLENTAPDFINLLMKYYSLNLSPSEISPRLLHDSQRSGGHHNPKVASSNLATITTNLQSH